MANEFVQRNIPPQKDCEKKAGSWGRPMTDPEYIWYGNKDEKTYPKEACAPLQHHNAQIDNFTVNNDLTVSGTIHGTTTGNKLFDIPHVKKRGKRIRHVIAEGPEAGIYIRGRLKDTNIIPLPEYWDGLIDPESITVTLTQIGYSQDLIVGEIEWGKAIPVKSGNGANINCYYEVWAARWLDPMDHDKKLHVVYEGETPDDYPGGNENFLIGGWDYDRRETQWREVDKKD